MKLEELIRFLQEIAVTEGNVPIYLEDSTGSMQHCSLVRGVTVNPDAGAGRFVVLRSKEVEEAHG